MLYVFTILLLCKSHHLKPYFHSTTLASPLLWNLTPLLPEVLHQSVNVLYLPNIWNSNLKAEFALSSISWSMGATIKSMVVAVLQPSIVRLVCKAITYSVTFFRF